jgi:hypothetical protein
MVTVTYIGENPLPVFGRLMLPGERRELNPKQAAWLDEEYPGRFEFAVDGEVFVQAVPDTSVDIDATDAATRLAQVAGIKLADVAAGLEPGKRVGKPDVDTFLREHGLAE